MVTEDYVSFETAKLLKEKGFDEKTLSYYEDNVLCHGDWFEWNRSPLGHISAPTLQMAMKWLREVYNLFIYIDNDDLNYNWQVFDIKNRTRDFDPTCLTSSYGGYDTYERAVEEAIKHCLENLI